MKDSLNGPSKVCNKKFCSQFIAISNGKQIRSAVTVRQTKEWQCQLQVCHGVHPHGFKIAV